MLKVTNEEDSLKRLIRSTFADNNATATATAAVGVVGVVKRRKTSHNKRN